MTIDELLTLVKSREADIFSYAQERGIDPLTLRCRLLLHLPLPSALSFDRELDVAAAIIEEKQYPYKAWLVPPEQPITLDDLEFGGLDETTARIFHECFHYVGSFRPGRHYAMREKSTGRIVCMGSVANFDLKHVKEKIGDIDPESVLMLSRFYAFRWAPKRIFSHFWGKLRRQMLGLDVNLMFSFINPNLGFDAASHKAAQWTLFAYEQGTNYMYLGGRYQTMRDVLKRPRVSYEVSTMELKPLMIWAIPLQRRAEKVIPATPYLFKRPGVMIGQSQVHATTMP
jgi:hypothetical protein